MENNNELKDYIAINEFVDVIIPNVGQLRAGKVIKKHVVIETLDHSYDLEFTRAIDDETKTRSTVRIYNVEKSFCWKRTEEYLDQQYADDKAKVKELEDLRRWKKEFSDEWFPVMEFMREHDTELRIGDSIAKKVIDHLKLVLLKESRP